MLFLVLTDQLDTAHGDNMRVADVSQDLRLAQKGAEGGLAQKIALVPVVQLLEAVHLAGLPVDRAEGVGRQCAVQLDVARLLCSGEQPKILCVSSLDNESAQFLVLADGRNSKRMLANRSRDQGEDC